MWLPLDVFDKPIEATYTAHALYPTFYIREDTSNWALSQKNETESWAHL